MTAVIADRIESAARAIDVARNLAAEFAVGAAARDRDRELPYAQVDRLAASGLLAITVPAAFGGADLPPTVVAEAVRIIATADPNIAQIPHSHFVYLNLLRLAGTPAQQTRYFGAVLDGARIANAQSERGGATVADIATTVRPDGERLRIDGAKYYCTGSLFADLLAVLTRLDDPNSESGLAPGEYVVYLPADTPGVRIVDDWNGIGQRTTGSGTIVFDGVLVDRDQLVARASAVHAPTGYGAFAQLLHAAIDAGIARGALTAATDFVRQFSRPWFEAGVERAVDDPLLIQRFGELAVGVTAAEATLSAAGFAVDAAVGEVAVGVTAAEATLSAAVERGDAVIGNHGTNDASGGVSTIDPGARETSRARPDPVVSAPPQFGAKSAVPVAFRPAPPAGSSLDTTPDGRDDSARSAVALPVDVTIDRTDAVAHASLAVATAKILADRAANEVSAALFEVAGTRSVAADLNLHHFWRNARTHTLHDPVRWKYQHIGRALLHDTAPPQHGVF